MRLLPSDVQYCENPTSAVLGAVADGVVLASWLEGGPDAALERTDSA